MQTLSLAFEAVTRVHFPEALGHVALRLVPCPPICAAAYALVSKYWSRGWKAGVDTQGPRGVDSHLEAPGTREAPMGRGGGGRGQEVRHLGQSPAQLSSVSSLWLHHRALWDTGGPHKAPVVLGLANRSGGLRGGRGRPGGPAHSFRPSSCSLSPYSHDGDSLSRSQDHIPLAALPLLATSSSRYQGAVATVIARTNQAYAAFLRSSEGAGFCGQVRG